MLKTFFNLGDQYSVRVERTAFDINGTLATVRLKQHMDYILAKTHERREMDINLEVRLEEGAEGWRLTNLRRR